MNWSSQSRSLLRRSDRGLAGDHLDDRAQHVRPPRDAVLVPVDGGISAQSFSAKYSSYPSRAGTSMTAPLLTGQLAPAQP